MCPSQDGAEARAIASVIPYFPFKGIPRFYDIGGFLAKPKVFQQIVDIFVERFFISSPFVFFFFNEIEGEEGRLIKSMCIDGTLVTLIDVYELKTRGDEDMRNIVCLITNEKLN